LLTVTKFRPVKGEIMVSSIETFVKKLKDEGVQAGRDTAADIMEKANSDAEKLINDAKSEAEKIMEEARREAELLLVQQEQELKLAARDAVLKFQEGLSKSVVAFIKQEADKSFSDERFFTELIRDTVLQYAAKDTSTQGLVTLNVSEESAERLSSWVKNKLATSEKNERGLDFSLLGSLKSNGFEYTIQGEIVEITPESIAEVLGGFVSSKVRVILSKALD
jgi:vacuolar-type H+-ATPase subunit E/Vma4